MSEQNTPRRRHHPWSPDGAAFKALRKTIRHLQNDPDLDNLSDEELSRLGGQLGDLIVFAEELSTRVADALSDTSEPKSELDTVEQALLDPTIRPEFRRTLLEARDRQRAKKERDR